LGSPGPPTGEWKGERRKNREPKQVGAKSPVPVERGPGSIDDKNLRALGDEGRKKGVNSGYR